MAGITSAHVFAGYYHNGCRGGADPLYTYWAKFPRLFSVKIADQFSPVSYMADWPGVS